MLDILDKCVLLTQIQLNKTTVDLHILWLYLLLFRIELVVDNRANISTLSTNGIRNAVSLQPVLYVGGIPNSNHINLTDTGFNAYGFQGCLSSFIVDGRLLDYQTALVLHGKVKMNVCSGKFNSDIYLFIFLFHEKNEKDF